MTDTSPPGMQIAPKGHISDSSKGNDTSTTAYGSGSDRHALERLLRLGLAESLDQGRTIDFETSEELSRLIPIVCAYFSREELARLIGEKNTTKMLEMHRTEALQNLLLEHELQKLLRAFNEAAIRLMLFKGPALAYTFYPESHLRTYHDIDALIHPHDVSLAHGVLTSMGYSCYEEYRAHAITKQRSGYNYLLTLPGSRLEVLIELHVAPHESDIGTNFDVKALWARAQPITVLGEPVLTMHPLDHLLYLCWHYRFHGFTRLVWLYDLVVLVRAAGPQIDWVALVQAARRQHLAATIYYCLCWCRDLFGVAIPAQVFAALHPPLAVRLLIERVAIPDVAKTLAMVQGRSRRVLAHHAMVDSTAKLLGAAARTFFPAPTLLGERYMQHSRLPLRLYFLYYFIHPWLTLAKGCRYLLTLLRRTLLK